MHSVTRRLVLASATGAVFPGASASSAAIGGVVTARAEYRGRDGGWDIVLTDRNTARFTARMNSGIPIGTIEGEFQFYDTEVLEKQRLPRFLQLPKTFLSPNPSVHPWFYKIALRNPETDALYQVEVWFERNMPHSEELRFFFEIWRNIWRDVPGYPRAPGLYAG